ncbi:hypothetical protein ABK040_014929 [Willaertia magna]
MSTPRKSGSSQSGRSPSNTKVSSGKKGQSVVLSPKYNTHVYFEISINEEIKGKIIFELMDDKLPKTCLNFKCLCTGEKGKSKPIKELNNITINLHYKETKIHRIIPNFIIQGGDILNGDGTSGYSIHGKTFDDESFEYKHEPFVLTCPNYGENTNTSQFAITLCQCPWLDETNQVFGKVKFGFDILELISRVGSHCGKPKQIVSISNSGQLTDEEIHLLYNPISNDETNNNLNPSL